MTLGGSTSSSDQNGLLGYEYWNKGLNFFAPWPAKGAGNYKLYISQGQGWVGIGKHPAHKLDVNGNIAINGTVKVSSDVKLKKNIQPLDGLNSLLAIKALKTYTYQYISDELPITYSDELMENSNEVKQKTMQADLQRKRSEDTAIRTGFMAQEVMEILPNLVDIDDSDRYTLDILALIPILTSALQEQNKSIELLESEMQLMQKEIRILKQK